MPHSNRSAKQILQKELASFLGFLLVGILFLPIAIYLVGHSIFGTYGGGGFGDFYGKLHYELRSWQPVPWYLVLSPYLAWQLLRLTIWSFVNSRKRRPPATTDA